MWKFFILCMIWKYCVRNFSNFLVIVMTLLSRMISEFIWKKKLSLVELKFWALRIFHLHNFYIENLVFFWMNFFSSKNFQKYQKKFFCSNIFFSNKNFFLQKSFCLIFNQKNPRKTMIKETLLIQDSDNFHSEI